MKTKKFYILALLIVCCVAAFALKVPPITPSEEVQIDCFGMSTLQGLKGVEVSVTLIQIPKAKQKLKQPTERDLEAQVELALRTAGLKVYPEQEGFLAFTDLDIGQLQVDVFVKVAPDNTIGSYLVRTQLYQVVELARNRKIRTCAVTWPLIFIPDFVPRKPGIVEQAIKDEVARQTSEFINEYLAANHKQPTKRLSPPRDDLPETRKPRAPGTR